MANETFYDLFVQDYGRRHMNSNRCETPWKKTWVYIYCVLSVIIFAMGVIGMMSTAYNRSGTTKRRVYSAKGI